MISRSLNCRYRALEPTYTTEAIQIKGWYKLQTTVCVHWYKVLPTRASPQVNNPISWWHHQRYARTFPPFGNITYAHRPQYIPWRPLLDVADRGRYVGLQSTVYMCDSYSKATKVKLIHRRIRPATICWECSFLALPTGQQSLLGTVLFVIVHDTCRTP